MKNIGLRILEYFLKCGIVMDLCLINKWMLDRKNFWILKLYLCISILIRFLLIIIRVEFYIEKKNK